MSHSPRFSAPARRASAEATVLLEVLLALALFVFGAAVISAGLHAALRQTARSKSAVQAMCLAESALAEVQLGIRPFQSAGEEAFPAPWDGWTAAVEVAPYTFGWEGVSGLSLVTVTVRNARTGTAYRLARLLPNPQLETAIAAGSSARKELFAGK